MSLNLAQPNEDGGEEGDRVERNRGFFVTGGEAALIFHFEEKGFDQMAFAVGVPVDVARVLFSLATGDNDDAAA